MSVMTRLVDYQSVNEFFDEPDIGSLRLFLNMGFIISLSLLAVNHCLPFQT